MMKVRSKLKSISQDIIMVTKVGLTTIEASLANSIIPMIDKVALAEEAKI